MKTSHQEIVLQSKTALKQHAEIWDLHAKENAKKPMRDIKDFMNIGIGRACVLVANGASLETQIETLKKAQGTVDIMCCDKTLGTLIDNGITPTYCCVMDARVNYERYMEPWKDKLKDTILFSNVCGNPKWTDGDHWKSFYFMVNEDVLQSELHYMKLSGCKNAIPAATNVSNAMVVLLILSTNQVRRNFFGYDRLILVGFDYSWDPNGNYYAFNKDGDGKHQYMRHNAVTNNDGDICYSSTNLMFSARWLEDYCKAFNVQLVQTTKKTIFHGSRFGELDSEVKYSYKPYDREIVKGLVAKREAIAKELSEVDNQLKRIGKEHFEMGIALKGE